MVKASGQIEQELSLLQQKTEAMADTLEPLYEGYLKALSEASKRQLVQAAYHLCTQAYPDKFLALSWDKRNQLQQSLQAIATQIYEQLTEQRERSIVMSRRPQNHDGLAFLQQLLEARTGSGGSSESGLPADDYEDDLDGFEAEERSPDGRRRNEYGDEVFAEEFETMLQQDLDSDSDSDSDSGFEDDDSDDDDIDFEMEVPPADQRLSLDEEEDLLAALEGLARRSMQIKGLPSGSDKEVGDKEDGPLTPIHLMKQQMLLEKAIRDVFKTVSDASNELLQKADVMPTFPKALMAAASDSRGMGEPINSVPNVVRMSVRVMHGESMMEDEEDGDEDYREVRNRDSRRSDREGRRRSLDSPSNRRSGRSGGGSTDRHSGRRRSSGRGSGAQRPRPAMPPKIIEIDALPELAAISLRLSEVEFTDPTVSAWRGRLRQKLGELKKLGMRYKKTQRSLETAQAEDAWRSSWTVAQDDDDD